MTPSVTESQILAALRTFLLAVLPSGVEVVKGQANKVAEPASPDFVVMTHVYRKRIATNVVNVDASANPPIAVDHVHGTLSEVQLDIHGPNSTDNAQIITTLWRDPYGCEQIDSSIFQPLHATDGHQVPFINGEGQYEDRWVVTLSLQSSPIISTPMQFADILTPNVYDIGSNFP